MQTPDPEFASDEKDEVEFTNLDWPFITGKVLKKFESWSRISPFRARAWMTIAIIAGIAILVFTVLHGPQVAKVTVHPVQINYPVSLSVVGEIGYTTAPDGVVTAFRVKDGVVIWRHVGKSTDEQSATVVDGVIYLTPNLPFDSHVTTVTVHALRARDGSPLWSRTLPTDAPAFFQLTVMNKVVYVRSAVERIDALRASDGTLLWHYTSRSSFVSLPTVSNGVVYAGTIDGHLYALRASDGFLIWTHTMLTPALPLFPVVVDSLAYLNLQGGDMDVLRADTGVVILRYMPKNPAMKLIPLILVADGVVYVSTQDGHLLALDASDGFTIWSVKPYPADNSILLNAAGGVVYVAAELSGSIDAVNANSGSIIWRYPGKAAQSVPIAVVQGMVYLAEYANNADLLANITALRASDGTVTWKYTPYTSYRQLLPVDGDDIVLISLQDGSVEALRASSGSFLWRRASNS